MDNALEKKYGKLILYMVTAGRLLCVRRWNQNEMPTVQDWVTKLQELAEMAKLTSLVRGEIVKTTFFLRMEDLSGLFVERRKD